MPNIDKDAKDWQERRSFRFGRAVAARRNALRMTAAQLAARTKELGFPMTRSTIARIEGNHRAGKLDVAEVLTLAAALGLPPALLLFPGYPDGAEEVLPGIRPEADRAIDWFCGKSVISWVGSEGLVEIGIPGSPSGVDHGVEFVGAVDAHRDAQRGAFRLRQMGDEGKPVAKAIVVDHDVRIAAAAKQMKEEAALLWGRDERGLEQFLRRTATEGDDA